jgi:hypothetical protein
VRRKKLPFTKEQIWEELKKRELSNDDLRSICLLGPKEFREEAFELRKNQCIAKSQTIRVQGEGLGSMVTRELIFMLLGS